jgi:hypothetical protein
MLERLGPYAIEGLLGRGGMGAVYRARHRALGTTRAVKVLEAGADPEAIERFRREGVALARLGPSVAVAVHEVGIDQGRFYYAMDLLEGGSLRDRMRGRGRFAVPEAVALVAHLARSLAHCHALGVVHRDLKPENVLFPTPVNASGSGEPETPRLADFGCARDLASPSALTASGAVLGTPLYMAPEQLAGERSGPAADVYALALILRELVTGEAHGRQLSLPRLYAERRGGIAPLPSTVATKGLAAVLAFALAPDPASRPSAEALARALDALARPQPMSAPVRRVLGGVAVAASLALALALAIPRSAHDPGSLPSSGGGGTRPGEPATGSLSSAAVRARLVAAARAGPVTSGTVSFAVVAALARRVPEPDVLADVANAGIVYALRDLEELRADGHLSPALRTLHALATLESGAPRDEVEARLASIPSISLARELHRTLLDADRLVASVGSATRSGSSAEDDRATEAAASLLARHAGTLERLTEPLLAGVLAPAITEARRLAFARMERFARAHVEAVDLPLRIAMLEQAIKAALPFGRRPAALCAALEICAPEQTDRHDELRLHQAEYLDLVRSVALEVSARDPLLAAGVLACLVARSARWDPERAEALAGPGLDLVGRARGTPGQELPALLVEHALVAGVGSGRRHQVHGGAGTPEIVARALVLARRAHDLGARLPPDFRVARCEDAEGLLVALLDAGRDEEAAQSATSDRAYLEETGPLVLEAARRRGAPRILDMTNEAIRGGANEDESLNVRAVLVRALLDRRRVADARAERTRLVDSSKAVGRPYNPWLASLRLEELDAALAAAKD